MISRLREPSLDKKLSRKQFSSLIKQAEYDREKGEIRIAGTDWILMSAVTFRDLVKGTERLLGSGAVVIWLEAGKYAGKTFVQALLRGKKDSEKVPKLLESFFTQGGWGHIQANVDSAKKEALVTIRNSATARQIRSNDSVCYFIRGFIAGACDAMFNDLTECFEIKCIAKGDALCEFQVKRKKPA